MILDTRMYNTEYVCTVRRLSDTQFTRFMQFRMQRKFNTTRRVKIKDPCDAVCA